MKDPNHNVYKYGEIGFSVKMGTTRFQPLSPLEEFKTVAADMPQEVQVLVSGGIDSEVMVKLLQKVKKRVTAVAYRYMLSGECVNQHDLAWICELDCPIRIETIDLSKFWMSDWYDTFLENHYCPSPQLPIQAYMALKESLTQFTVLPAIHPEPKLWDGKTHVQIREKDFAVMELLAGQNCMVSPLQYSAEMYASILASDEFVNFESFGISDGRERKPQQYKEWFDIDVKRRPKYHGFEGHEWLDNRARQMIWDEYEYQERWMFIPAEQMLYNMERQYYYYNSQWYPSIIKDGFMELGTEK